MPALSGLRKLTLRQKLTLITLLTSIVALLLASAGFVLFDLVGSQQEALRELQTTAEIVAANSTGALGFENLTVAQETLRSLRAEKNVTSAALYTLDGELFAIYVRPGEPAVAAAIPPHPEADGTRFAGRTFRLFAPVSQKSVRLGTLFLQSDLGAWVERVGTYLEMVALLMFSSVVLTLLLSAPLQRLVSGPVLKLERAMQRVSNEGDYSLRAEKVYEDEIGALYDGFNRMVAAVQDRDAALQRANEGLETRVRERTEELEQEVAERRRTEGELQRAKEAADAAGLAKSQFLATMSHEIRTPMNAVLGMAGLLMDTRLVAEQQEYVRVIRHSGDSLLAIINHVLDFSKIEAGQLELEREPFDLRECVEGALELVAPRAAEKGLDLAYELEPETPRAYVGDVTRLREILINLLSNAVKFTERGEVVLTVASAPIAAAPAAHDAALGAAPEVDESRELLFSVRDTGIGIPAERQDRLFRSFSQVDASTTRRYGGTGLGLAISRQLCELMGGRIRVESRAGAGSVFRFTVRLTPATTERATTVSEANPLLAGKRLLVVVRAPASRRSILLQAAAMGMDTAGVATVEEAIETMKQAPQGFDLAVVDPDPTDGPVSRLRATAGYAELPLAAAVRLGARVPEALPESGADSGSASGCESVPLFAALVPLPVRAEQLRRALLIVLKLDSPTSTGPLADRTSDAVLDASLGLRRPLRILVAEDITVNQALLVALLGRMGYRADVAADGVEVLSALGRQRYDLVLMDLQMPVMDGIEATRRARSDLPLEFQPQIVAVTANALRLDRQACAAAGMNGYLTKPIQPAELQSILIQAAANRNAAAAEAPEARVARPGSAPTDPTDRSDPSDVSLDQTEVLDAATLAQLRRLQHSGNGDILQTALACFRADAKLLTAAMRAAVDAGDAPGLQHAAHSLKGAAANVGGIRLAQACRELEQLARSGTTQGAEQRLSELEPQLEQVYRALEQEIQAR